MNEVEDKVGQRRLARLQPWMKVMAKRQHKAIVAASLAGPRAPRQAAGRCRPMWCFLNSSRNCRIFISNAFAALLMFPLWL